MRLIGKLGVGLVLLALTPFARAQVLDYVPADALAVVKVNKLADVNAKVIKLANELGLAQMQPALADPLATLMDKAGWKNGLDKTGDAAIVIMGGPAKAGPRGMRPEMLVLLPVTDYAAFVANFANPVVEGEITQVTVPNTPRPQFVTHWGKYAAMTNTKTVVAQKPEGLKISSPVIAKEFESKDVVLFANMPALREKALPQIRKFRDMMMTRMKTQQAKMGPYGNMAEAAIGQEFAAVEAFIRDSTGAALSLNISDAGLNFAGVADFAPESYLGQNIAKIESTDDSGLAGLPNGKYIAYGGYKMSPALGKMLMDFTTPIIKSMAHENEMGPMVENMQKMIMSSKSATMGIVAPRGALGTTSLVQGYTITHGDATAIANGMRQYFTMLGTALVPPASAPAPATTAPAEAAPNVTFHTDVKANAKVVDGISFDMYSLQIAMNPRNPQEAQAAQGLAFLYGPNGMTYYMGVINDQTVLTVMGNDNLLGDAVTSAKANTDVLGQKANVKAVAAQLPKNHVAIGYFALDELLTTVATYAAQFGFPVNLQLPPDLPPIGMAVTTENSSARAEAHVPTQLVQSIVAAVMQTMMQMQGGQGGPGAPGAL